MKILSESQNARLPTAAGPSASRLARTSVYWTSVAMRKSGSATRARLKFTAAGAKRFERCAYTELPTTHVIDAVNAAIGPSGPSGVRGTRLSTGVVTEGAALSTTDRGSPLACYIRG